MSSGVPFGPFAPAAIAVVAGVAALISELRDDAVPNSLTLPLAPIGFLLCLHDGRWIERGIALVVAIGLVVGLYRTGAIGGGAVKLIGGLVVLLGASAAAVVLAVVLALLVAYLRRKPDEVRIVAVTPWVLIGCLLAGGADYVRFLRWPLA